MRALNLDGGEGSGVKGHTTAKEAFGRFNNGPADSFANRWEAEHGEGREHKEYNAASSRLVKAGKDFMATAGADHQTVGEARAKLINARDKLSDKARFSESHQEHREKASDFVAKTLAAHEMAHATAREAQAKDAATNQREHQIADYERFVKSTGGDYSDYVQSKRR